MTHEDQSTCFEELLQLLSEHGFDGMGEAIQILMNEAMKLERAETLGAMPYQLQRVTAWLCERLQAKNGQQPPRPPKSEGSSDSRRGVLSVVTRTR